MAFARIHAAITDINPSSIKDYIFSTRGGILLNLKLTWFPFTFFDVGTADEVVKGGDIHVVIADSALSTAILGQSLTVSSPIVVPQGGSWTWAHPDSGALRGADAVVSKLAPNLGFPLQPVGLISGNLRLITSLEPVRLVQHHLMVEAELIAFDSSVI